MNANHRPWPCWPLSTKIRDLECPAVFRDETDKSPIALPGIASISQTRQPIRPRQATNAGAGGGRSFSVRTVTRDMSIVPVWAHPAPRNTDHHPAQFGNSKTPVDGLPVMARTKTFERGAKHRNAETAWRPHKRNSDTIFSKLVMFAAYTNPSQNADRGLRDYDAG